MTASILKASLIIWVTILILTMISNNPNAVLIMFITTGCLMMVGSLTSIFEKLRTGDKDES